MKTNFLLSFIIITLFSCKTSRIKTEEKKTAIKTYTLLGDDTFPEGISIDQRNGIIYTGSMGNSGIQLTENGISNYFLNPLSSDVSINVLGTTIDKKNNRLWVCSNDINAFFSNKELHPMISVFDLSSKSLIKKFTANDIPNNISPFLNDVILDNDGNAYISNTADNAIVRISSDLQNLIVWNNFPLAPKDRYYILNGIEVTKNQKNLIVSTYKSSDEKSMATLFKVNTENGSITEIKCSSNEESFAASGIDGIVFIDEFSLIGVSGNGKLLKIDFNSEYSNATITDISTGTAAEPYLNKPATVAIYNKKLYVTNAQALNYFSQEETIKPFEIVEIPFELLNL